MASDPQLEHLRSLLPATEVFDKHAPQYKEQAQPWSIWADQNPKLVLQPTTIESMQKVVKYLYESDLDFAIRATGTGSVSAKDVILSTHGFKDFHFDEQSETVTLGGGYDWGSVDKLMEKHAPGFAVVGARCSWVGVTGSALVGGLSWLSHEFGMISDPSNLLDMQVVLGDGRAVWASEEEEELMWALRGGGGNFGIVTAVKLRARPYPTKIFAGLLSIPYSSLPAMSKVVSTMAARTADPKLAMHVCNNGPSFGQPPPGSKPDIAVIMFDANGEAHGRSDDGFGLIMNIDGCQEFGAGEMTLQQVNALAEGYRDWQGRNFFWLSAPLLAEIDDETVVRAWKWWEDSVDLYEGFQDGSIVLLEFMQEAAFTSSGGKSATAWPHDARRHVMQLAVGCRSDGAPSNVRELAIQRLSSAGREIGGPGKDPKEYHAGFLHEWNDLHEVYGDNLGRLKEVKRKYDPKNRFNKGVDLFNERITNGATV